MKLNLGCGHKWQFGPDWANLDIRSLTPPVGANFTQCDVRKLPEVCPPASVEFIYAHDILEHLWYLDARKLLADCYNLLQPGGSIEIKTPEISLLMEFSLKRVRDLDTIAFRWYGGQDYPQNVHQFCWPERLLVDYLTSLGFTGITRYVMEDTNVVYRAVKP